MSGRALVFTAYTLVQAETIDAFLGDLTRGIIFDVAASGTNVGNRVASLATPPSSIFTKHCNMQRS